MKAEHICRQKYRASQCENNDEEICIKNEEKRTKKMILCNNQLPSEKMPEETPNTKQPDFHRGLLQGDAQPLPVSLSWGLDYSA